MVPRFERTPEPSQKKRVIDRPSDRQIRLIDEEGKQVGIVSEREAYRIAMEKGLDLVEVAPHLNPPTCRIMDWGRYQYQLTKKQHKAKKSAKKRKEIQIRPKTERHDIETKLRHARRFLESGHKVLVILILKGREMKYAQESVQVLKDFAQELQEVAKIEREPKQESGNRISMILSPKQTKGEGKQDSKEG